MIRSKKNGQDPNTNRVQVMIGSTTYPQDLISLTVWDEQDKEYSIKELLEKILKLEKENAALRAYIKNMRDTQNATDKLIVNSVDLLSLKMSQVEDDIKQIKKYHK